MNELITQQVQLPDNIEDLTQFVLVGRAKLQAYMMKLQTITKLSVAQEIRDQTMREAQDISTALIAAEQRIGELLLAIPKATTNHKTPDLENRDTSNFKTKQETVAEMGYTKDESSEYQRMALNPEVVDRVIREAIASGQIVTKTQVMKEIRSAKKEADAWKADYAKEVSKRVEKQDEILRLQEQLEKLKEQTNQAANNKNLSENVYYFCMTADNFIGTVGGLVWLTDKVAEMPKKERDIFLKAAKSIRDWASAFTQNLERSMNDAGITD